VIVGVEEGQFRSVNYYSDEECEHSHSEVAVSVDNIDYPEKRLVEEEGVMEARYLVLMAPAENKVADCSLASGVEEVVELAQWESQMEGALCQEEVVVEEVVVDSAVDEVGHFVVVAI
jgi:hypothetical protein